MSKFILNVDTDLDEQIEKCEQLIKKYEELGDKGKQLRFITIKELAEAIRLFRSSCTASFFIARFSVAGLCKK